MTRKHQPVFEKLLKLLGALVFIAKARKLSIEKYYSSLVRKSQRNRKRLKFMEHYNYGFIGEYEFSPSNTPLIIHYTRKQLTKSRDMMKALLFVCGCWGSDLRVLEGEERDRDFFAAVEALPTTTTVEANENALALMEPLDWGCEEASIDMRAQMFIERFYEDMKMQTREST